MSTEQINENIFSFTYTSSSRSCQGTCTIETELSNFQKLVVTILKTYFPKQKVNIQFFQYYKRLKNDLFRSELDYELPKLDLCNLELQNFCLLSFIIKF